jgi:WS/DGAT/MGAT family acyltransferase
VGVRAGNGYERLSAQDSSFVMFDGGRGQLNISAVATFDAEPLCKADGHLDLARLRDYIASRLHLMPHYRQRLDVTPIQRHPIWIDDAHFDISHHVRRAALPAPGGDREFQEFVGHVASQPLDPARPLWEMWFVEGLAGERVGWIAKVHHCMADGVSGVSAVTHLLSPRPDASFEPGPEWLPQRKPSLLEFVRDGLLDTADLTVEAARAIGAAALQPLASAQSIADATAAGLSTLKNGFTAPPASLLNQASGQQRRATWHLLDTSEVKDLRKRLDGTINDVVLAVVAGGLRRFLQRRREQTKGVELRVIVPVDTRSGPIDLHVGNQVSAWFLGLPVGLTDPRERFEAIRAQTRELKRAKAERGVDLFLRFSDWSGSSRLPYWGVGLVNQLRPYNLIVTNVRGPEVPLFLLGARLHDFHPFVPLFANQTIAIALLSYLGRISIGVLADWDHVPELEHFAGDLARAFDELRAAAEGPTAKPAKRSGRRSAQLATPHAEHGEATPSPSASAPLRAPSRPHTNGAEPPRNRSSYSSSSSVPPL